MTEQGKDLGPPAAGSAVLELPTPWRRIGGGCGLDCGGMLSCDDEYEETGTGRRMRFLCTEQAHFDLMPSVILNMKGFLRSIAGRYDVRIEETSAASLPEGQLQKALEITPLPPPSDSKG